MSADEKLDMVLSFLDIPANDPEATRIEESYLPAAEHEILAWRYGNREDAPEEVPKRFEMLQIQAVVSGFSAAGAEGESYHSENGIVRQFYYPDMMRFIHMNVTPLAGVV